MPDLFTTVLFALLCLFMLQAGRKTMEANEASIHLREAQLDCQLYRTQVELLTARNRQLLKLLSSLESVAQAIEAKKIADQECACQQELGHDYCDA